MISIFIPLFASPCLIYLFVKHRKPNREQRRRARTKNQKIVDGQHLDASISCVVGIVFDPYRKDLFGGLCWEGVMAFRRLILVIASTLIPNVLIRHMCITLISLGSLLSHIRTHPFIKPSCNFLESCSLTILLMVSVINLLKASYFQAGNIPADIADKFFLGYDWIEAFLLGLIPVIVGVFVVFALLMTLVLFVRKKCQGPESKSKSRRPSKPTGFYAYNIHPYPYRISGNGVDSNGLGAGMSPSNAANTRVSGYSVPQWMKHNPSERKARRSPEGQGASRYPSLPARHQVYVPDNSLDGLHGYNTNLAMPHVATNNGHSNPGISHISAEMAYYQPPYYHGNYVNRPRRYSHPAVWSRPASTPDHKSYY